MIKVEEVFVTDLEHVTSSRLGKKDSNSHNFDSEIATQTYKNGGTWYNYAFPYLLDSQSPMETMGRISLVPKLTCAKIILISQK